MTNGKSTRLTRDEYQTLRLLREIDKQQNDHSRSSPATKVRPDSKKSNTSRPQ